MKRWRAPEHLAKGILALFAVVVLATAAMAWRNTERLQVNDRAVIFLIWRRDVGRAFRGCGVG